MYGVLCMLQRSVSLSTNT